MAFQIASFAAVLADQVAKTSTVGACLQVAPDPWWKWLFQTVAPVAGGTLIAVWSFHSTGKRDHDRWVLDQKKAEWGALLSAIRECRPLIDRVVYMGAVGWERMAPDTANSIQAIYQLLEGSLFIDRMTLNPVLAVWLQLIEITKKGEDSLQYTVAFAALMQELLNAARKDLGIKFDR